MGVLGFLALIAIAVGAYRCALLPRLRRRPWWDGFVARLSAVQKRGLARLRGLCGNSKTIAVAYGVELLGILDEARLLDWSELVGSENAGRVMVVMGAVMIVLRLLTRSAVSFESSEARSAKEEA
jgi:hypothetical protein